MPSRLRGKYKARVKHNYEEYYLGYYDTFEEAAAAERAARLSLTGVETPLIGEAKVQWQFVNRVG